MGNRLYLYSCLTNRGRHSYALAGKISKCLGLTIDLPWHSGYNAVACEAFEITEPITPYKGEGKIALKRLLILNI